MEEDNFLVEAAGWARYYEKANEVIEQIVSLQATEAPPQEITDNPQAFYEWVDQCKRMLTAQNR